MMRLAVFLSFAVAHFLSNFVRSANAVIAGDLARDVAIGPSELGLMTSLYFLAFAVAQLPLGAALDRFGARIVTPSLMLAAVAGSVLFAVGRDVTALAIGRVLLGLGTAGILMGGLKALASWYRPARFAAVSGALVALGSSGSLVASTPLAWMAQSFGWRSVFAGGAVAIALSAAAVAVWGRAAPAGGDGPTAGERGDSVGGFLTIFASPAFWRAAGLAIATTGVTFALQSLWAGPYLARGIGLDAIATGNVLLAFGAGISVGYLLLGAVGERLGPSRVLAGMTAVFVACQAFLATTPPAGAGLLTTTFLALGLAGAASALLFALVRAIFAVELTGRAVTALNLFMFAGGFAIQWGLGAWLEAGLGGYGSLFAWTAALGAIALVAFLPEAFRRSA